jgi:hypothetical protein
MMSVRLDFCEYRRLQEIWRFEIVPGFVMAKAGMNYNPTSLYAVSYRNEIGDDKISAKRYARLDEELWSGLPSEGIALFGKVYENAEDLLRMNLHPQTVLDNYSRISRKVTEAEYMFQFNPNKLSEECGFPVTFWTPTLLNKPIPAWLKRENWDSSVFSGSLHDRDSIVEYRSADVVVRCMNGVRSVCAFIGGKLKAEFLVFLGNVFSIRGKVENILAFGDKIAFEVFGKRFEVNING